MSTKYNVKPGVPIANSRLRNSITPPSSTVKQRIPTTTPTATTKVPSRPSSDTKAAVTEESKMSKGLPKSGPVRTATSNKAPTTTRTPTAPRGPPTGGRSDLVPCKICERSFAPDRIQAHNDICSKTSRKKRKPFDVAKQRIKGTELEPYTRKTRTSQAPPPLTKSNWRKKHEEFIANIRAAKEAQAHVAKGGKLSDLPPPPPMDTSDLIPCPHCKRKFNEGAAERHIPKCATMLHNKPKISATANKAKTARR